MLQLKVNREKKMHDTSVPSMTYLRGISTTRQPGTTTHVRTFMIIHHTHTINLASSFFLHRFLSVFFHDVFSGTLSTSKTDT